MLIFVHDITSLLILNISQRAVVATMHPFETEPNIFVKFELASRQARCFSQQLSLYQISSGTSQENHAIAIGIQTTIEHENEKKKGEIQSCSKRTFPLLGALASTTSSVVGKRASRADGLVALADVAADVVVTATDLTVDGSLVLGAADALEVGSLGLLAGGRVDVAALGQGDLAVVAGALATDLHFGTGELVFDGLVDAGLDGWKEEAVRIGVLMMRVGHNLLESEAPAAPRAVSSTRWDCLALWELRSASACLAMAMGS